MWYIWKNKERIQKLNKAGDSIYIYQNELEKSWFQHGVAYGDFKDVTRRTAPDNLFCNNAFDIAKNPEHDGYQRGLSSMVYNFFDKETSATCANKFAVSRIKNKNYQLAEELYKQLLKKLRERKVVLPFRDNIFGATLDDMQLIANLLKELGFYYLLLIFSVNMHGLLVWKIKDVLQLLTVF